MTEQLHEEYEHTGHGPSAARSVPEPQALAPLRSLLTPCHTKASALDATGQRTGPITTPVLSFLRTKPPADLTGDLPWPPGHPQGWKETRARAEAQQISHIVFQPLKLSLGISQAWLSPA